MKHIKKNKLLLRQLIGFINSLSTDNYYSNLYIKFDLEKLLDMKLSTDEIEDIKNFFSEYELFIKIGLRGYSYKKDGKFIYGIFKKENIKKALRLLNLLYIGYHE